MKKHKFHFIIALSLISALLFNTCKKYPEGGLVYYRIKNLFGKNEDHARKSWNLKLYEVNGIDSTNLIQGYNLNNDQGSFVTFYISNARAQLYGSYTDVYGHVIAVDKNARSIGFGYADVVINHPSGTINDTSQCFLINNVLTCQRNIFNPEKNAFAEWNIRALTETELIISKQLINNYRIILTH